MEVTRGWTKSILHQWMKPERDKPRNPRRVRSGFRPFVGDTGPPKRCWVPKAPQNPRSFWWAIPGMGQRRRKLMGKGFQQRWRGAPFVWLNNENAAFLGPLRNMHVFLRGLFEGWFKGTWAAEGSAQDGMASVSPWMTLAGAPWAGPWSLARLRCKTHAFGLLSGFGKGFASFSERIVRKPDCHASSDMLRDEVIFPQPPCH